MTRHRLGGEERALQVDADDAVEIGLVEIEKIARGKNAGVVDQHVDLAVDGQHRRHEVVDRRLVADVAGDEAHRAEAAQRLDRRRAAVFVDVGDDDARAFFQESSGDRMADAARRAGDDGNLVLEKHQDHSRCHVKPYAA